METELERRIQDYLDEVGYYAVHHTVQLTSFGGSGTTALGEHLAGLGADLPTSPGMWPFKHGRTPPAADQVPPGYRVVYLLGDPRDAVLSVFRRSLQVGHYRGLRDGEPDEAAAARLADVATFLDAGVDDFELADHLDRWWDHPSGYPVLFVRFDRLEAAWPTVCEHVGLPADAAPLAVAARHSDWRSLPDAQRRSIDAMYGELAARIAELPATVLR